MKGLRSQLSLGAFLITHEIGVVAALADEMVVLGGGHVAEWGSASRVRAAPEHQHTHDLLNAAPTLADASRTRDGVELRVVKGVFEPLHSMSISIRSDHRNTSFMADHSMDPPLTRLGCGEWGFRNMSIDERARGLARIGMRVVEFGVGGGMAGRLPEEPSPSDIKRFRQLHEDYGLEPRYGVLENDFTLRDRNAHVAQLARTERLMRSIAACGARHVRLFTGFMPIDDMDDAIWSQLVSALERMQTLATELDLVIGLETHHAVLAGVPATHVHTATTRADGVERLLAEMPEEIGFLWDPGNIKTVDPDDHDYLIPTLAGRVVAAHLKDWRRDENGWQTVEPGADDIDYDLALRRIDYDGVCLIEYDSVADPIEGTARSRDYLVSIGAAVA